MVVLKPNVTSGERNQDPDTGITTHPAFIAGLIRHLKAHGANPDSVHIIEDPHNRDDESPCHWRGTGFIEMANAEGASLSCPTRDTIVRREIPDPLAHASRLVSEPVVRPGTVLINVPKLKTHNLAITTLCMKNQQGLVYVLERHYCSQALREIVSPDINTGLARGEWMDDALHERWQEGLARRLADLAKIVVPSLNVVEGVVGRDGTGFSRGRNYPLGLVVVGINMVGVDAVASYLMGFDPESLIYLNVAAAAGLGTNRIADLNVYCASDGDLAPCADLDSWRADPPFRVLRGLASDPDAED